MFRWILNLFRKPALPAPHPMTVRKHGDYLFDGKKFGRFRS
jgi:hypothetical protein